MSVKTVKLLGKSEVNKKMSHLKYKFTTTFMILGVFLILCASPVSGKSGEKKVTHYQKVQRFVLATRSAQETEAIPVGTDVVYTGANFVNIVKGYINWIEQGDNGFVLAMKIVHVDRQFVDPKPEKQAALLHIKPFIADVSMSKGNEVPLSIRITEGKIQDNSLELAMQYRLVYLILDMMCATAVEKEFIVSKDGWGASLSITYPNQVNIDEYGDLPVSRLKSSFSPTNFTLLPRVSYKEVIGSQLFSFTHGSLNIKLFSRLLDKKTGFATHAVNLEATSKVEMKDKDYTEMIRLLNAPDKFQSYNLHELEVTTAETEKKSAGSGLPLIAYALTATGFGAGIVFSGVILLLKKKAHSRGKSCAT